MSLCWIMDYKSKVQVGPLTDEEQIRVAAVLRDFGNRFNIISFFIAGPTIESCTYKEFMQQAVDQGFEEEILNGKKEKRNTL